MNELPRAQGPLPPGHHTEAAQPPPSCHHLLPGAQGAWQTQRPLELTRGTSHSVSSWGTPTLLMAPCAGFGPDHHHVSPGIPSPALGEVFLPAGAVLA